jgi:virulence-associated protein VagC
MIAKVFKSGNSMALRLPRELNPKAGEVSIEPAGNAWLIEPVKSTSWPRGFFDQILITSPGFKRAPQGRHRSVTL